MTDGAAEEGLTTGGLGLGLGLDLGGRQPHGSWARLLPDPQTFRPHREKADLHLTLSPPSQYGYLCQLRSAVAGEG